MLDNNTASNGPSSSSDAFTSSDNNGVVITNKRKRRPAGTPDPDAEVVSLSPKTLLESDKYVCEICNQGFQRDQNLQMHRRRHKVPWKLLKRETPEVKKRVFVCPEPSCLHHDPCHALGDLVGIKKHFRRKHSNNKQWVCEKCSKGYAVQSDYKAHLKTCGTRGHSCDCGRVFSRVESFIEHQDTCTVRPVQPDVQAMQPACSSHAASSNSPSSDNNFSVAPKPRLIMPAPSGHQPQFVCSEANNLTGKVQQHSLELQLLPSSYKDEDNHATDLNLSIGSSRHCEKNEQKCSNLDVSTRSSHGGEKLVMDASRMKQGATEQLRVAMAEKAFAEQARQQAKRQLELAEMEFSNAKRIRQQAQAELEKAQVLKEQATKKISETISEITCHACRQRFQATNVTHVSADETSPAMSYMSSATTDAEGE
ncbi:zinc finger protein SHOOT GRAVITROPISM 5 [Coffea eugenioides]|uniref:zinc finger protein SHOOT GRAVITROPISM 5 n=1 Tax=Coffea eugenioides TaxID=49369 RepID=UPI000F6149C0|nr:zinc finger protein SHOOT GRAVITROPISM 5 [Coffea eugenioides]